MEFDLVVLVPDADWEQTIRTLLGKRRPALGIGSAAFELLRHPGRDGGVRKDSGSLLQGYIRRATYCLVCLDYEGSGGGSIKGVEREISAALAHGWPERSAVVVAEPELEAWVWSGSPHVGSALGWTSSQRFEQYLEKSGKWPQGRPKPPRPKEAMEAVMREAHKPRSPAVFADLANKVSLRNCQDQAFGRLLEALTAWFPAAPP